MTKCELNDYMETFENILGQYRKLDISQTKEEFDQAKIDFVYHSNKLEGSNLTLIQTQEIIQHHAIKGEASVIDSLMAIDHYRALNQALSFGANKYPLSEKMILQLHETLLKSTFEVDPFYENWKAQGQLPGAYKIKSNRILFQQGGKEIYYETPTPEQGKELVLKSVEHYLNSDESFLVKLSKLIQNLYNAHAMFDGNKRITRLVIAQQLLANDLPLMILNYNDGAYNEALMVGFVAKSHKDLLEVLTSNFSQYLSAQIEEYQKAKKIGGKGLGFIL